MENRKGQSRTTDLQFLVGLTGFEPAASASRTQRSTKLSHNPKTALSSDGYDSTI